jgi:CheY-like chemotaxis protein
MNVTNDNEILLVEDNQDDLELALRALRKGNLAGTIRVVGDGAEALDYIFCEGAYAGRNIENRPQIILLDLKLPKVDGIDVLKRIRSDERTKTIPVVMLTASKEQQDMINSCHLGVDGYIVKPVEMEKFAATVEKLGMCSLLLKQGPDMQAEKPASPWGKLKLRS